MLIMRNICCILLPGKRVILSFCALKCVLNTGFFDYVRNPNTISMCFAAVDEDIGLG